MILTRLTEPVQNDNIKEVEKALLELFKIYDREIVVEGTDVYGNTSLILSAYRGNEEILQLMLSYGANVDFQNDDKETALMSACENYKENTARILLEAGADISIEDFRGWKAIHHSAGFERYNKIKHQDKAISIIRLLIEYGCDPDAYTWNYEHSDERGEQSDERSEYDRRDGFGYLRHEYFSERFRLIDIAHGDRKHKIVKFLIEECGAEDSSMS